jgi:hypothetical protein
MRLTHKDKNGPTVGVNAPNPVVMSTSTLAVKKALTLALLGVLVTVWGCSKAETNRQSTDGQGGSAEATPQSGSVPTTSGGAPAAPAAVVIATAEGETSGTRVEVTELKRLSDNTVNLKIALVNDTPEALSFNYNYGDSQYSTIDFNTIGGVTLVDGTNKKKYFVVRDTENNCLCSRGLKDIPAKSRGNAWAKFPAPPDDVQKISVVIPHFGPMDDVPISR